MSSVAAACTAVKPPQRPGKYLNRVGVSIWQSGNEVYWNRNDRQIANLMDFSRNLWEMGRRLLFHNRIGLERKRILRKSGKLLRQWGKVSEIFQCNEPKWKGFRRSEPDGHNFLTVKYQGQITFAHTDTCLSIQNNFGNGYSVCLYVYLVLRSTIVTTRSLPLKCCLSLSPFCLHRKWKGLYSSVELNRSCRWVSRESCHLSRWYAS